MKRFILAFSAALLLAASPLFADVKIGYVDMEKAILGTAQGKAAKEKLEKEVAKREGEFKDQLKKFQEMEEQLSKQVQLMSEDMKRQKLQEYQQKGMELQQKYQEHQKSLLEEQEKAFAPILEKLRGVIQEIGLQEGYTIILEKRQDGVLYAMPQLDRTAPVVATYK